MHNILKICYCVLFFAMVSEKGACKQVVQLVKVFHYILDYWGISYHGLQFCPRIPHIQCEWTYNDKIKNLNYNLVDTVLSQNRYLNGTVTVALYNIHSWWEKYRDHYPANCDLNTNLTLAESEESSTRFHLLFDASFPHYDGNSTTNPQSSVPRIYVDAYLNSSQFYPLRKMTAMISGGSYVASDCHKRDEANANRDSVVQQLRAAGLRIDGLGRCLHSIGPGGFELVHTRDSKYNLETKREAISHYLFNMAFENSIEPGYVTEKSFDPLLAGSIPVYLGDATYLKTLLPHPSAAIFVSDFRDINALAAYLKHLISNETAYEYHRAWRKSFTSTAAIISALSKKTGSNDVPLTFLNDGAVQSFYSSYQSNHSLRSGVGADLLDDTWPCRVCAWAASTAESSNHVLTHYAEHKRRKWKACADDAATQSASDFVKAYEGKTVRGSGRTVYLVQNGTLRMIPNMNTFISLKLDFSDVVHIDDWGIKRFPVGEDMPST